MPWRRQTVFARTKRELDRKQVVTDLTVMSDRLLMASKELMVRVDELRKEVERGDGGTGEDCE